MQTRSSALWALALCTCLTAFAACSLRLERAVLGAGSAEAQAEPPASAALAAEEFDLLNGAPWTGTLTDLDYGSQTPTTLRCSLVVQRLPVQPDGSHTWDFCISYADEPSANSVETFSLSPAGNLLRDQQMLERTVLPDGTLRIVTEQDGEDDERAARLRFGYLISAQQCSLQKLVRLTPEQAFFERHIYRWSR